MRTSSYFEEINIAKRVLSDIEKYQEKNSELYEVVNLFRTRINEFENQALNNSADSEEFKESYSKLIAQYLVVENKFRFYISELNSTYNSRASIKFYYNTFFKGKENVMKLLTTETFLTKEHLETFSRIYEDSECISFYLDKEEVGIVHEVERVVNTL